MGFPARFVDFAGKPVRASRLAGDHLKHLHGCAKGRHPFPELLRPIVRALRAIPFQAPFRQ